MNPISCVWMKMCIPLLLPLLIFLNSSLILSGKKIEIRAGRENDLNTITAAAQNIQGKPAKGKWHQSQTKTITAPTHANTHQRSRVSSMETTVSNHLKKRATTVESSENIPVTSLNNVDIESIQDTPV